MGWRMIKDKTQHVIKFQREAPFQINLVPEKKYTLPTPWNNAAPSKTEIMKEPLQTTRRGLGRILQAMMAPSDGG